MQASSLLEKAVSLLSRRDYSRAELQRRLQSFLRKLLREHQDTSSESFGHEEDVQKHAEQITAVLTRLEELGYLNDDRVSASTVRVGIAKGQGPQRIKAELKHKVLSTDVLHEVEDELDWFAQARQVRSRRFGDALPDTPKEKARQLRFLLYRGFTQQQALQALKINEWDE
ncbi:regulatory protein RecX [Pokkaliibacter plantistimulans]|uniref:regulatory protein RecX n=1 Tax=Pokkaliibacter plantistimulans TaxID=1635171 RepID=UPI001403D834|nr:regulatory protein RecX [Pokkaliibacter plantistimulans]